MPHGARESSRLINFRGKYDMVRVLLKLGSNPNFAGDAQNGMRGRGATALDACIFGLSYIPPEVGRYATSTNRMEYFEDHYRCLLYLIAAGGNPEKSMCSRLQGGFFHQLFEQTLK